MNFDFIKKIVDRQGFYIISQKTLDEIKHGHRDANIWLLPVEASFNRYLALNGLQVYPTSDKQISVIKNIKQ